jgi:hypothetical protein
MFGLGIELRSEVHRTAWSLPISTHILETCHPRFPTFANHRLSVLGIHGQRLSAEPRKVTKCSSLVRIATVHVSLAFHSMELVGRALPTRIRQGTNSYIIFLRETGYLYASYTAPEHGYMSIKANHS